MEELELDKEIKNPLSGSGSEPFAYRSPSETIKVAPSNREIAAKVNEIIRKIKSEIYPNL